MMPTKLLGTSLNLVFLILVGQGFLYCIDDPVVTTKDTAQVFTQIYEDGLWGFDSQHVGTSGGGSAVENAKIYMDLLQNFLKEKNIKSVVDIGCGDWQFSRYINWQGIDYVGYDVVKSVIESNIKRFANQNCLFVHGDAIHMDLPKAELLICKDVLQHLPNHEIMLFLKKCAKFKYCLITNNVDFKTESSANKDIKVGEFRSLDLTKKPFNVKGVKVLTYINEKIYPNEKRSKKQVLCLTSL